MFKKVDIGDELSQLSSKARSGGDILLNEAHRILKQDLFTEGKILENLVNYNRSSEFVNEEDVEAASIFTLDEIKKVCILYRLKFLNSKVFKDGIPYEVVLRIKYHNASFNKDLRDFKILAPSESFLKKDLSGGGLIFVKTNYDNYYLVHKWGNKLKWHRKLRFWPMQQFENLFVTIILATLLITLSLPTGLITLDAKATYWSGYRAAAFFHLLIFNTGVTAYTTFAFAKNFSSSVWNREQDFD